MAEWRLHQRLGYRISRLARIMQVRLESLLADDGLTRMMWLVLTGIGEDGVRRPSEMADYIGITRPASSRLLSRMERLGYITRSGADGDGRGVDLALTGRGVAVLARMRPRIDAMFDHFTAKLAPGQLAVVMDGLGRMAAGESGDFTSY